MFGFVNSINKSTAPSITIKKKKEGMLLGIES